VSLFSNWRSKLFSLCSFDNCNLQGIFEQIINLLDKKFKSQILEGVFKDGEPDFASPLPPILRGV
jgi:hypothetical protein